MRKIRFKFDNDNLKKYLRKYLTNKGVRKKIKENTIFTDRENLEHKNYKIILFTDKISYKEKKYLILLPDKRQNIIKKLKNYLIIE